MHRIMPCISYDLWGIRFGIKNRGYIHNATEKNRLHPLKIRHTVIGIRGPFGKYLANDGADKIVQSWIT